MYTRMLVQVKQCKMQKCTMHMHNATTNPRKRREKQTRPTKLTKEKSAIKRGNCNVPPPRGRARLHLAAF